MLDPGPRDFTNDPALSTETILGVLERGRPGTAMKSFAGRLSEDERALIADYIVSVFAACDGGDARYHTPRNGWPDHLERYGAAVPFATGAQAIDVDPDTLPGDMNAGRQQFLESCISCHEPRRMVTAALGLHPPSSAPQAASHADHDDEYDVPTIHDIAPRIADLTPVETEGKRLWALACAQCHAADGTGKNWIGKFLDPMPPDLTDPDWYAGVGPGRFAEMLLSPRPGTTMPSFRDVFSTREADAIASYAFRAFRDPAKAK